MSKALLYIHGKGGNAQEIEQYKPFFAGYDYFCGLEFEDFTPFGTRKTILDAFINLHEKYNVSVLANSIGAYFSMLALQDLPVEKAFFISPILDMEKIIFNLMKFAGVTEKELSEKGEIKTDFGENLSWKYLCYVRENKIMNWNVPTEILYGENDNLTSLETVEKFIETHNANLTIMKNGEHWFHTKTQMEFLYKWLKTVI